MTMFQSTPGTFRSLRQIAQAHAEAKSFTGVGAYEVPPQAKAHQIGVDQSRVTARNADPRPTPYVLRTGGK